MKFTDASGLRPENKSLDPVKRVASSPTSPRSPRQNRRMQSRNLSFHSRNGGGKPPSRYPSPVASHGSAINLSFASSGSPASSRRNAASELNPPSSFASTGARSKRKPSTPERAQ